MTRLHRHLMKGVWLSEAAPDPTGLSARQAGLPGGARHAGAPDLTGVSARQAGLPGGARHAGAPDLTGVSARQAGLPGGARLEGAPDGVVLGRKLAKTLGVDIGDEIVLLSQAADGSMANELYRVQGILKSVGDAVDRAGLLMGAPAFRSLMAVPTGAHEIVVVRPDRTMALEDALVEVRGLAPGLETLSWRQLLPTLARMFDLSFANSLVLLAITYLAILMVVLNATLMSVFERIREFGVMKALGVTPIEVLGVVFVEVLAQAGLAGVLALALGVPVSLYYQVHGIDLSSIGTDLSFEGVALDPIWYCHVSLNSVLTPVISLFLMVGLAALYPGMKAAFLGPLEAIRHR